MARCEGSEGGRRANQVIGVCTCSLAVFVFSRDRLDVMTRDGGMGRAGGVGGGGWGVVRVVWEVGW